CLHARHAGARLLLGVEAEQGGEHARPRAPERPEQDVVEERRVEQQVRVLERARDAAAAVVEGARPGEVHAAEPDGARRGPLEAGDQVERRGLAGAVGTDEPEDLAGSDREAEVADGLQAPEALAEALDLQQGPGAGATGPRRGQPGPARERRPAPRQGPGDD